MIAKEMFSRRWFLATLLVIAGAALCARLGIWQLDRLQQRRAANAHYIEMQAESALQLPKDSSLDLASMEYRAISVSGNYDFAHQVAIRNQSYKDENGYHLLTPLVFDNGKAVLVDRGWIPAIGNAQPSEWSKYDQAQAATVHGILRLSRDKADFTGETDPPLEPGQTRLDVWTFPNIPRIQQQMTYQLLPVYIQLDPDPNATNPPIPYQPEVDLTEGPHQGYAIQWFSFATILIVGYPFYVRRHRTSDPTEPMTEEVK